MRLRFHPEAVDEARPARRWYCERDVAAATSFMADLDRTVRAIIEMPAAWPQFEGGTRRCLLRRFPYYVIYRQRDDITEVVAAMHARREPGYWRGR